MRHRKAKSLNNRFTSWRKATLHSLARNLIVYQRITTTLQKAKAVKPLVEKLISMGKLGTLAARRHAFEVLNDHQLVKNLFNDIAKRFEKRAGGYTRIIRLGQRRGDNAEMVIFELTEIKEKAKKAKKEAKGKESKAHEVPVQETLQESEQEPKQKAETKTQEKPILEKKPTKKFLGGLRNIFKKERDSL
ncbi:MAG: 50S ribosomal protein L17 [Candidatus Omnitrophota bacterium]|jgi:large subunit ribosomal protein L17